MVWLPDGEKISKISVFVLIQLTNVTDTQTLHDGRPCLCVASRGKNVMNGAATHEWTIVGLYDASYVEDILSKKPFWPSIWRPPKILPPKVTKPTSGTQLKPSCKVSRRSARDICPRAKIHIFPMGTPLRGYCPMLYIFGKLSSSQCYAPFDM